jgi:stage V sporulation protein R
MTERLFEGADWDFHTLQRITDACEAVALKDLGLDVYPNQIEVITAEQMLDAYSSVGMPLFYKHWSFGKQFAYHEASYRKGLMGLAYEIVINSSPCISYLMEENTATMQTLVIAHAAFGHNHFFKNNYLFKQWTDADGILDYLDFAKNYVMQCEETCSTSWRRARRGWRPGNASCCASSATSRNISIPRARPR